ncbi:MAG TPA: cytidine deaminase [Kofleriaceae bacterium]|nr:cytidine deaminase [Kofleriaceae bacterium]
MTISDDDLIARARAAQQHAYAPYSHFDVGAALAAGDRVFEGANVENASYGLATCAERSAVVAAAYAGVRSIDKVAVCTNASPPSAPCGSCRQILLELSPDPSRVRVIAANTQGERREWTLAQLIPDGFTGKELP